MKKLDLGKLLDQHSEFNEKVAEYFGVKNGIFYAIDDCREKFWALNSDEIQFDDEDFSGEDAEANYSECARNVYRKDDFTMVFVHDSMGDDYYMIFDNEKEIEYE